MERFNDKPNGVAASDSCTAGTTDGQEIERLIQLLARLPGLGPRSARRAALHMIQRQQSLMEPLSDALSRAVSAVTICGTCGNIDTKNPCPICSDPRRDHSTVIVIEDVSDLWALERAAAMNAAYHVLGGTLSPLDGVGPEDLRIAELVDRVKNGDIKEVIIAVNATVEGQTTAHYITEQLDGLDVAVSRLAHGVPVGGELDYLDEGTLSAALRSRTKF
ncbi:MAG: recombination mediator RecR [Pseudomonadota bacterium]